MVSFSWVVACTKLLIDSGPAATLSIWFARKRGACMLLRRDVWVGAAASLAVGFPALQAQASTPRIASFDALLASTSAKENELEEARAFRELDYRDAGPTQEERAAQPGLARRYSDGKVISARAHDLLVRFEVSSKARYEARYRAPIWPKGSSGVTIGIGYDIGYTSADVLKDDWQGLIPAAAIAKLSDACGKKGGDAEVLVAFFSDIDVPWAAAAAQLQRMQKFVAGETLHSFPAARDLSDDAFGALVSLVYNRGGSLRSSPSDRLDRRREMRAIRQLLQDGRSAEVPAQIRAMTRLWAGNAEARGLLDRRELDDATCRISRARVRFTPAKDDAGNNIGSSYQLTVRWQLPED